MDLQLRIIEGGHLLCEVAHEGAHARFVAWDAERAMAEMSAALENVTSNGIGECVWEQPTGCYRWMFRQEKDRLRIAIIRSSGVVTGWEHVLWAEGECAELYEAVHLALQKVRVPEKDV